MWHEANCYPQSFGYQTCYSPLPEQVDRLPVRQGSYSINHTHSQKKEGVGEEKLSRRNAIVKQFSELQSKKTVSLMHARITDSRRANCPLEFLKLVNSNYFSEQNFFFNSIPFPQPPSSSTLLFLRTQHLLFKFAIKFCN